MSSTKEHQHIKPEKSLTVLFCILLGVSLAIQDVRFLGELFGPSAASLGGIFISLGFILFRGKKKPDVLGLRIRELLMTGVIVSLILLPTQERYMFGETVWVKALKVALSLSLLLMALKYGQIFYIIHKNLLAYVAYSYLGTVFLGVFLERIGLFPKVNKSFLHFTVNLTERPRGFATEPSTLAYSLSVGLGLIAILHTKSTLRRQILLLSILISGFFVTLSRGYIGTVALTVSLVSLLFILKRIDFLDKKLTATILTTFLLVQSIFIGILLRSSLWANFSRGMSDATREVWARISIDSLVNTPFGAGYQGLITAAPSYLQEYVQRNSSRFTGSSLRELVLTYSQSSDFAISPKTLTALFVITTGVFGVAFLFNLIYKITYFSLRNEQVKFWQLLGIFLVLFTLLNYCGGLTCFAAFFLLGVFIERYKTSEKSINVR